MNVPHVLKTFHSKINQNKSEQMLSFEIDRSSRKTKFVGKRADRLQREWLSQLSQATAFSQRARVSSLLLQEWFDGGMLQMSRHAQANAIARTMRTGALKFEFKAV